MEASLRRAVLKALKSFEKEPALVIEPSDGISDVSDEKIVDIRAWLF